MEIDIYTDGSCFGNPGPGGWAAIILIDNKVIELSGGDPMTDNNIMEMTALIEALKLLVSEYTVNVYSDSGFIINALEGEFFKKWEKNGWLSSSNREVAYKDLWLELIELCDRHNVNYYHIRSHSGNKWNERCDNIARERAKRERKVADEEAMMRIS